MLFAVEINAEEEAVRASIEPKLAYYNSILKNVRREIVFLYHNNEFNPNHTNNLHQNEWQKRLNLFDKSHINIDFAYSDSSRYIYPNELSLYRIRHQLNVLSPSHFHHCLINPSPFHTSTDLLHVSSDVRRLARWLTHTSIGLVFSGGAARGWGHVGVVKAMNELNLPIDMCGGTSAGSMVGAAVSIFRGDYALVKEVTRRAAKFSSNAALYMLDATIPVVALVETEKPRDA